MSVPDAGDRTELPRGLVLFDPGAGHRYRRLRFFFLGFCVVLTLSMTAPVYPLFSRVEPYVAGLPLSFAWVVGLLLLGFAGMLALYLSESRDADSESGGDA